LRVCAAVCHGDAKARVRQGQVPMLAATQRIKREVAEAKVNITLNAGVVTMKGSVDSYKTKTKAEACAKDVVGVLDVVNELAVVPGERYGDELIAKRVVGAFERNDCIDPSTITVEVDRGEVTLTGTVPDFLVRALARGVALCTAGVLFVENRLIVRVQ